MLAWVFSGGSLWASLDEKVDLGMAGFSWEYVALREDGAASLEIRALLERWELGLSSSRGRFVVEDRDSGNSCERTSSFLSFLEGI